MDLYVTLPLAALAAAIEAGLGYPQALFKAIGHPVTWIGALIARADHGLNRDADSFAQRRALGFLALGLVLAIAGGGGFIIAQGIEALAIPHAIGLMLTALIASSLIAQRSLHAHVRAVADALEREGLAAGRTTVAAIVGRDVVALDEAGVARAAIESLAENFSDGVVAPIFWLALGGLPGGMAYKAINTADSMMGHRTARHVAFGFAAARLDDLVNLVPARLSALLIATAALFTPGASAIGALRTAWRFSGGHPSPNAGWPEAAFAGALGLRLGGPRCYGQIKIDDPWIGAGAAVAGSADIRRALALYRRACFVHWVLLTLLALGFIGRA
ncbi:adenosylcobinamide-phosphate synthase CbiB [Methylocapsa acidiphila]|uniref:adenosylcobinamide-phosphate synthase CbiB n=1 Tax=Methylocapsa acidiphila TaxID=133552 RepID=UPI0003FAE04D|nr:adenosylcobinamide-phosphate synthase CbiB [Methylocapsa acidiphila]